MTGFPPIPRVVDSVSLARTTDHKQLTNVEGFQRYIHQVPLEHCSQEIVWWTFWTRNIFWFIIVCAHVLSIIRACSIRRRNWLLERVIPTLEHSLGIRPDLWHRINNIVLLLEQLTQPVHVLVHEITLIAIRSHHHTFLADKISTLIWLLHLQHALSLKVIAVHTTHRSWTYLHSVALRNLVNVLWLGHSSHSTTQTTIHSSIQSTADTTVHATTHTNTHTAVHYWAKCILILHQHRHSRVSIKLGFSESCYSQWSLVAKTRIEILTKLAPLTKTPLNHRISKSNSITRINAAERLWYRRKSIKSPELLNRWKVIWIMFS